MKNKRLITLALILVIGRLGLLAQTAGITGGAQWLWLYDDNYPKPVVWTYTIGFQQTFIDKVCLGIVYNASLDADIMGYNDFEIVAEPGVYIRYHNSINKYNSISFESRYFLNDFDKVPIGVYIASSYKYGFFNSTNTIDVISDQPGSGSSLPLYKQLVPGVSYESAYSIHSFGLKVGLMAGPAFNFYAGYDYNLPFVTENQSIQNSNLKLSPAVVSSSLNLGVSLGFGIGY